jgi:hypothetical protein
MSPTWGESYYPKTFRELNNFPYLKQLNFPVAEYPGPPGLGYSAPGAKLLLFIKKFLYKLLYNKYIC